MNTSSTLAAVRWTLAFSVLSGIVGVYSRWLHVNNTTVALTLLLFILVLAAEWGLRYAVAVSLAATVCYNFFFLPPVGTLTIADPQNWLTLFAFLATAIVASRLSHRARNRAKEARSRQRELEVLFRLSRELLQSDSFATLLTSIPSAVASVTAARSGLLYLLEGDRLFQAGVDRISEVEIPHLKQLATSLTTATDDGGEMRLPIRSGVRPKGLVLLRAVTLSLETAQAIASLISISIDRAQALEGVAKAEATKENESLRALMIDSITHELRTPLTSIKGAATALLNGNMQPEQSRELLEIIDEESDRLNRLVSEAVEMAQLDTQQVQMQLVPTSVQELIETARDVCSGIEEHHPLQVDVPSALQVIADPAILQKVICNLLENAAKYSNAGAPIKISAQGQGTAVAISVADRGVGIDPSEQALVFERFYRARSQSLSSSGTGMGLAISRAITEAHGGTISVTSQPGQGSVFTILIPAVSI